MGLNIATIVLSSLMLVGCVSNLVVNRPNKKYVACCDPGLNADDKDLCKWMYDNHTNRLRDRAGNVYEGVWHDCEPGKEPWRKYE